MISADIHQQSGVPKQQRICVAVSAPSAEALIARSATLLPEFPFQELRLDTLPAPLEALDILRSHIGSSLEKQKGALFLATCRRTESGGHFRGSAQAELDVLLKAAHFGCGIVDLAIESAEALPGLPLEQLRAAGARVMLSWHDFEQTGSLPAVLARMRPFAPDLCKIVPTATTLDDTLPLLQILKESRPEPTQRVGVSMGEAGVLTRVLGVRAGSAFTFAAAAAEEATAPGQITAQALRDLYQLDRIDGSTQLFGVAGDPIRSSLSPLMLNTAFRQAGLNSVYLPLLTHDAGELFRVARSLPLAGFSVTMPLKQAVVPFLQHLDPLAARIGAVNTIRLEPDGSYSGFNTDAAGIVVPLERRLSLRGARVLLLGAGGAARAAVFACLDRGAAVSILNRTLAAALTLAQESGAIAITEADLAGSASFDVLINATPAGMRGNPTAMPLQPHQLRTRLVFDLVYNPIETPLLQAARKQGLETISGVEMFVHQGARQFELWTGRPAPLQAMETAVLQALQSTIKPASEFKGTTPKPSSSPTSPH